MNNKVLTNLPISWTVVVLALIGLISFIVAGFVEFKNPLAATIALFSVLLTILKADADYQKKRESERDSRRFDIASKSHMATTIFDRQLAFSEEYYGLAYQGIVETFDWDMNDYDKLETIVVPLYANLIECRMKHGIFLTEEMQEKLALFESRLRTMKTSIEIIKGIEIAQNEDAAQKLSSAKQRAHSAYIELFGSTHGEWNKALDELQELIGITFLTETRRNIANDL